MYYLKWIGNGKYNKSTYTEVKVKGSKLKVRKSKSNVNEYLSMLLYGCIDCNKPNQVKQQ